MRQKKESPIVKWALITVSVLFLAVMLVLPLCVVLFQAFRQGVNAYLEAVQDEYTVKALLLTLEATVAAVVLNTVILSILVDTFISKISLPMQTVPEIGSISGA